MSTISAPASPYRHRDPNDPELTDACRVLRPAVREHRSSAHSYARPAGSKLLSCHPSRRDPLRGVLRCCAKRSAGNAGRRGHETRAGRRCCLAAGVGALIARASPMPVTAISGLANGGPSTSGALNTLSGAGIANFGSF
jgi:hypothetical protein